MRRSPGIAAALATLTTLLGARAARADDASSAATHGTCSGASAPARAPAPSGPSPVAHLSGDAGAYAPELGVPLGHDCMRLEFPLLLAGRVEGVSSFPVDRYGNTFGGPSASPVLRLGSRFTSGQAWGRFGLLAEAEADVPTGTVAPTPSVDGQGFPGSEGLAAELRKLHARASYANLVHLDVGAQTNHFGMGLLTNDGAHGWEPGSAQFVDPRSGNRVLGGELSTGPLTSADVVVAVGADRVLGDFLLLPGDTARQMFAALLVGVGDPSSAGAYLLRRHQENAAGAATDVTAIDVTARVTGELPGASVGVETEWALIDGTTALGATVDHPTHDVLELGGVARAWLDAGAFGTVIDFLYASGDQNPYDGTENGFRVDPNYPFGLLLFQQVVAAQSARTAGTASDPQLAGVPPAGVDRLPTRGSVTNTVAFFPKLRVRPLAGLEAYGGPLFAFTNVPQVDVFTTDIAGGAQRSSLGGLAGRTLGTELDVGVRYRALVRQSELTAGLEGGMLLPGSAFLDTHETPMGPVYGGRAMVQYRF